MSEAPVQAARGQTAARSASVPKRAEQQPAEASRGARPGASQILAELKVSGHLMTLEDGLYCIVQTPAKGAEPGTGLPGVRLSLPPGPVSRPDSISIAAYRPDGWLSAGGDAALVRVTRGPAQLLVTIYQSPAAHDGGAPNIQVMRLLEGGSAGAAPAQMAPQPGRAPAAPVAAPAPAQARTPAVMEMVAHIQERGDVGAMLGDWLGERGSKRWIEGFGLSPTRLISPKDMEYQGVLGQGWLSPWVEGGQFCGSRAMALPLLGLRVRLRGEAAQNFDVAYAASFIDGSSVGPVLNGEACEADSLAALEAFQIVLRPRSRTATRSEAAPAAKSGRGRAARTAAPAIPEPLPIPPAPQTSSKGKKPATATEPAPGKAPSSRSKR